MEIIRKSLLFASRPSRSLKVIGTDTDRSATYDFLLVFYSNCGSIWYRLRDKGQYLQNFPTIYLTTVLRGVTWNFVMAVGLRN